MCPVHSEDHIIVNASNGRATCSECSRIRERVGRLKDRNRRTGPGRHPRESLFRVSNAALRERYELLVGSGVMAASEIAVAAGYITKRRDGRTSPDGTMPDVQRLKKHLGVISQAGKPGPDGKRPMYVAETVGYDAAVLLGRAMGVEYLAEVGV